ncbi:MAG: alpha/beta hydrolase [Myxococcota bacterium]
MTVTVDGAELEVEVRGEGAPVVCLHAGIADSRMWSLQDPARWGRMVTWDRRGFGRSRAGPAPWSPVADAVAVVDALGIERAVWMGCSMGGRLAIEVALAHPERVSALVLVAPAVSGAPFDDGVDPALIERYEALEQGADPEALVAFETWFWLDGTASPVGRVDGPARALVEQMNRQRLSLSAGPPQWPDGAWQQLERLPPTVLAWGSADAPGLVRMFEAAALRVPRVERVVFDGAAHFPNLEDPRGFDARARAALDRVTASS